MTRFFDHADATGGSLGDLPVWDLTHLYPAPDAPELSKDLDWLGTECADFAAQYEGKLNTLDGAGFATCITRYERLSQVIGRIMSYAGLRYYQNTTDPERAKAFSDLQAQITDQTTPTVFFSLELNRLDEAQIETMLSGAAARYRPWMDRVRAMAPHQLSDELEKFLHDQSVVGTAAWNRLFDETMAGLSFEVDGESLPLEATLNLLTDTDRAQREAGARALADVFTEKLPLFARITNTLAKEKEIEDRWRKFDTPQA
ncbi:MAG: oligoendopeptidase F, partial [Pseudomonadota bacterium]